MPNPNDLPGLADILELATLEHDPARWRAQLAEMRADGIPMNDGPDDQGAGGTGGEGGAAGAGGTQGAGAERTGAPAAGTGGQGGAGAEGSSGTGTGTTPPAGGDQGAGAAGGQQATAGGSAPDAGDLSDADLAALARDPEAVSRALQSIRGELRDVKTELRDTRRERDVTRVALDLKVPESVLHGATEAELRASAETFIQERDAAVQAAVAEAQAATAGQSGGARPRPVPKDLDAQILAAEEKGDWGLAGRLKAQKLGTAPAPTT